MREDELAMAAPGGTLPPDTPANVVEPEEAVERHTALASAIERAVAGTPGVVEVYPTVANRIGRGIADAVASVTAGHRSDRSSGVNTNGTVKLEGVSPVLGVEVHIGVDASASGPDVARSAYESIASIVGEGATITVRVSRIERTTPLPVGMMGASFANPA